MPQYSRASEPSKYPLDTPHSKPPGRVSNYPEDDEAAAKWQEFGLTGKNMYSPIYI